MAAKGQRKTGGRKRGTPNKRTEPLIERAEKLGIDPFEILLHFAKGNWECLGYESATTTAFTNAGIEFEEPTISPELRVTAAKAACEYLHPKRKAIEIEDKGEGKMPKFMVLWADDDGNDQAQAPTTDPASKED